MTFNSDSSSSHPTLSHADSCAAMWQDFLLLAGRVLIGWVFVLYGWGKLWDIPKYALTFPGRGLSPWMAYIAVPVEFFVGLALVLGFATRYAAVIMFIFMVIATFSSHRYWSSPEAQRGNQQAHFWKNISIMGGIALVFVTAGGRFSLDRILFRNKS